MFNQLLPQSFDNTYRGHRLALWLFALLVVLKVIISLNSIFNGYSVATSADGIPLDTYPSGAAQTVVSIFALSALSAFMLCLLSILALARYRSMIPIMIALFLLEFLSKRLVLKVIPIVVTGTPPGFYVTLVLFAVMIVGLTLSLRNQAN